MSPQRVVIKISDPWDLGEALSWRPLEAELLQVVRDDQGGHALVRLQEPVKYGNASWSYAVAAPRYKATSIDALQQGTSVACAFTGISDRQALSSNPLDIANWRGGLAFNGDLEPSA